MPAPTVLHLLGSWINSKIEIPFPSPPDLFAKQTSGVRPHILLTQFSICNQELHTDHFPAATTANYPRVWTEGDREDASAWEPVVYRNPLTHWNLNPAANLNRRRRQVIPADEITARQTMQISITENLGETESYASAYFYTPSFKKEYTDVYTKFSKTFADELEKKTFQTFERTLPIHVQIRG